MKIIPYTIMLFNNFEFFTKAATIIFITLMLYTILMAFIKWNKSFKEQQNIENINTLLNHKNTNIKIIYNQLKVPENRSYVTSKIFISGFEELTNLYKKGINDITVISYLTKKTMKIEILKEKINLNETTKNLETLKQTVFLVNIIYIFLSIIIYLKYSIFTLNKNINFITVVSMFNEILLPTIINLTTIIILNITKNKFANLNFKIYNKCKISIEKFLIILNYKIYE